MINTIKGVIAKIYPKESGTGKYGAWTKQSFVIEFKDGDKDRELHLTCMKPDILKGFDWINENGLNNSAGQCYEVGKRIKSSEEYRKWFSKRVSEGLKRYFEHPERIGTFTGKKHSEETIKKNERES